MIMGQRRRYVPKMTHDHGLRPGTRHSAGVVLYGGWIGEERIPVCAALAA
jgi:hypothetical protein